jgi:peptidyl-prolyl cis-trans isomerase C
MTPLSAIALSSFLACSPQASETTIPGALPTGGEVMSAEGEIQITRPMMDVYLGAMPEEAREKMAGQDQMKRLQAEIVREEKLFKSAIERSLHEDPMVKNQLLIAQRQVLFQALLQAVVKEMSTEEAIKGWYDSHLVQFRADQVQLSVIEVADKTKADTLLASLQGGADFATVAKENSKDPSAEKGGELGWVDKRAVGGELGEKLAEAKAGDVVGPLETPRGWSLMKLHGQRDVVPFDEAREKIPTSQAFQKSLVQTYIESLDTPAETPQVTLTVPAPAAASAAPAAPTATPESAPQ